MRFLFLLFIAFPILELWLLFRLADTIGATATVAEVLLSAVAGVLLLRHQGPRTLMRGRERLDAGELPAREMIEGMVVGLSGLLLLLPGVITDVIGLCGLLPWGRRWLAGRMADNARVSGVYMQGFYRQRHQDRTFEGEYWHDGAPPDPTARHLDRDRDKPDA